MDKQEQQLQKLLNQPTEPATLSAGFNERVMSRIAQAPDEISGDDELLRLLLRCALPAAAAALLFTWLSFSDSLEREMLQSLEISSLIIGEQP